MRWFLISLVATLGLAACSSGTSAGGYGAGSSSSASSSAPAASAAVATATIDGVGTVLVDGNGMTLYLFEADTSTASTCTGSCAGTWPAFVTAGSPTASGAADASMLGTTTRDDGSTQVIYNGHPLYLYSGDSAPGEANGEDVGGVWYAVTATGTSAEPTRSSKDTGGYGSGYGG